MHYGNTLRYIANYQVFIELKNTTNSYMWLYITKEDAKTPTRIFDSTETRYGDNA